MTGQRPQGTTLVETLLTAAVLGVLLTVIYVLFLRTTQSWNFVQRHLPVQEHTARWLSALHTDIRGSSDQAVSGGTLILSFYAKVDPFTYDPDNPDTAYDASALTLTLKLREPAGKPPSGQPTTIYVANFTQGVELPLKTTPDLTAHPTRLVVDVSSAPPKPGDRITALYPINRTITWSLSSGVLHRKVTLSDGSTYTNALNQAAANDPERVVCTGFSASLTSDGEVVVRVSGESPATGEVSLYNTRVSTRRGSGYTTVAPRG